MKTLLTFVSALACCAALAGEVASDRVVLKSGSVLIGKILGAEGDVIKFESEDFGTLDVKKDSIASLFNDEAEKEYAVTEVAPVPKAPETWHGQVNVGFQADRGNTYGNSASVTANLNRRFEEDRLNFDFGYFYTKNGTSKNDWTKSKDKIEAEGQYDHFWQPTWYNYVNVRYDRDVLQDLDYRVKFGIGFGYQWLENREFESTGIWSFNQELGVGYTTESYGNPDPDRSENYATFRYAHHLKYEPTWKYLSGIAFVHNLEYLPEIDDFSIFTSKADVGLTTTLIYNINLLAKIEWEFNSKPSADRTKNDTRYILGLGYKW